MPGTAVVLNVSAADIETSSNAAYSDSIVRLDKENGGGYMATIELFHQLHCLVNTLPTPHKKHQTVKNEHLTQTY